MASNFSATVIERLKAILEVDRDSDLAKKMDVNRSTLSTWRKNDSINLRKIHEAFPDVSMDVVLGIKQTELKTHSGNGERQPDYEGMKYENERLKAQVEILQQTIGDLIRE